ELLALAPVALVLDESHYCKNAAAKRTQAAQRLSSAMDRESIVLALTGTPVVNRPAELISQLRILGRLQDFGSGAKFGERFRGADAHLRLHWHLRARCFVRRLKADVLTQLPAKTRAVVPVELDNESEDRLAERDLVAWLRSQPLDLRELDAKVAAALRAERLVRLNALKVLAARGKLHAALTWIHDFCSSGERLVVFAHHREIQRAVLEHFPAALHILGADSHAARDAALQAFPAPDSPAHQLIVCSIEAAGHRLTPPAPPTWPSSSSTGRRPSTTRPRTAATGSASRTPSTPTTCWRRGPSMRRSPRCSRASGRVSARSRTGVRRTRRESSTRSCASCAAPPTVTRGRSLDQGFSSSSFMILPHDSTARASPSVSSTSSAYERAATLFSSGVSSALSEPGGSP